MVTLDLADDTTRIAEDLNRQPYVRELERSGDNGLRLVVDAGATAMPQIMRRVDAAGGTIAAIGLHRPSLDDVFLARTGRSLRDTEKSPS